MNQKLFTTLFLVFSTLIGFGQTGTVKGKLTDDEGGGLPNALIYARENDKLQSLSDDFGNYEIVLPANRDYILVFTFVGSKEEQRKVNLKQGQTISLDVKMSSTNLVPDAVIFGNRERKIPVTKLDPKIVGSIPTPQEGIEAVLMTAPVNFSSELSSQYSVRGGSFDENLVYVNDIQVYRPFLVRAGQQEGLSFPNPDMVDNIVFSAGGFEAKYGDKMSSVLDIKYRKPTEFGGSVSGSFLGGTLQLEGVSKNEKLTHNTGFRYKSNSYVLGSLDTQGDYKPNYTDLQTFITYSPKGKYGNLEFNFLGNYSRNKYNFIPQTRETDVGNINEALRLTVFFEGEEESQFETFFGAFSTNYMPSEKSLLKFIVSAFQTYEEETFDILGQYYLDELERDFGSDEFGEVVRNRGVGSFLEHGRNNLDATVLNATHKGFVELEKTGNYLEWGVDFQQERIYDRLSEWTLIDSAGFASPHPQDSIGYTNPGSQEPKEIYLHDVVKNVNDIRSNRVTGFVQNSWKKKTKNGAEFTANAGIRAHYWSFNEELVYGPRANISYQPKSKKRKKAGQTVDDDPIDRDLIFTLAGGWYFQPAFYREMRDLKGNINTDIKAQQSIHVVAGIDYVFYAWNRPFKFITEVYYKDMKNIIPYEVENVKLRYYATNNSKAYATGIDMMVNGEFIDGVQSWFRASYLKTEEDILDDFYYEYVNDEGVTIVPGYTLNDTPVDSTKMEPGYIPRPTDQRFSFSMIFQDEMPKWPEYKVLVSLFYGTGLPYGPPSFERYKDVLRTASYRRVDIGFSKDLVTKKSIEKGKRKWMKDGWISLEIFNILGINNTINHTWIEDVNGRQYAIPDFLTGRRINLKLQVRF